MYDQTQQVLTVVFNVTLMAFMVFMLFTFVLQVLCYEPKAHGTIVAVVSRPEIDTVKDPSIQSVVTGQIGELEASDELIMVKQPQKVSDTLATLTIRQLKKVAKSVRLPRYSRMTRQALIEHLTPLSASMSVDEVNAIALAG